MHSAKLTFESVMCLCYHRAQKNYALKPSVMIFYFYFSLLLTFCLMSSIPIMKFRHSNQPEPGVIRVHHGKAGDPDVASALVHGVSTKSTNLLNPPKSTVFQEKLQQLSEAQYRSQERAPLGRARGQSGGLPAWVRENTVFGVKNTIGQSHSGVELRQGTEVEREAQEAHELYMHSHNHYFVGERINRKYDLPHFSADSVFGLPTPHHDDGSNLAKTLRWIHSDEKGPTSISSQTFGILPPSDQYGAGEVIYRTGPGQYTQGPTTQRSLVHAIRHHLKKVNFHFFPSLLRAFRHYDKKGRGLIDLQDLEEVCREFKLEPGPAVLQDLLHYCDVDGDGLISFMEFANFLCWKDNMPIKIRDQKILTGGKHGTISPTHILNPSKSTVPLLRPEDLEPVEPGRPLRVPRTLTRSRGDPEAFTPSSALIGARHGGLSLRSCGVPTIRTDLPAPRLRRVSDRTNYGDTADAATLLCPHVHAALGVHEQDFLCPRSKQEIAEIFQNIGLDLSQQLLDEAWELATVRSPSGDVSVENFRNVLRELKAM
uniref:EF-hand domain-containing protein n=1 Tax=Periophthalmus magnuspinnatus TaxID=409849 RepID=A0A3B3ZNJ4_9GOBI